MLLKLKSERLVLQPFKISDASRVQELAGDIEVARTTSGIPHPYPLETAETWISNHSNNIETGNAYPLAIILKDNGMLIGTMTLRVDKQHNKGELAYWIGRNYWGNGFATEAARAIMDFGFIEINLNRIWAMAMVSNPASSRVMQKVGMKQEGILTQHILKSGNYEDLVVYGILKIDYKR